MADYIVSTCSTADISKEQFEERQIYYAKFHYYKNHEKFDDDLYQTMSPKEFFDSMANGAEVTTSQVNTAEFIDFFTPFLQRGKDILHLSLSTGISGVYNAAETAAAQLRSLYPERKIYVLDTLCGCSGVGLITDKAADLRDSGMDIDSAYKWLEEHRYNVQNWFFTSDLTHFVKGGRVSRTAGAIGGILGICPLLNVSNIGKLVVRTKVRPKKKVINEMVKVFREHAENGTDYSEKVFIAHSDCYEDCKAVVDLIEAEYPNINGGKGITVNPIGTVIGCHTGPGTVALFFWGDRRTD